MHSVLDGESVLSDPSEVLCCIGTLIIEGRTPKTAFGSNLSGEATEGILKTVKPYCEGPHCPSHVKLYTKETHKCIENNVLCIRHKNMRQHLEHLHRVSSSVVIEVSLGPDCLCGEFRSQSTLVSAQTSKRDTVLEQWIISTVAKETQESSTPQMSVANVYQAVRSLLHFSQLTAWYMSTSGMKPAHVMYRVVVPEAATYIADDDFVAHSLPMIDVNKTVSMKISLKTMPRKETIPKVFCLQHPRSGEDSLTISAAEELSADKKFPNSMSSAQGSESKEELLNVTLPLKFHGVRKKSEAQERKRKKHITLYGSTAPPPPLSNCSGVDILDSMSLEAKKAPAQLHDSEFSSSKRFFNGKTVKPCNGEPSKAEFKKPKPSTLLPTDFSEFMNVPKTFQTEVLNAVTCKYGDQKLVNPSLNHVLGLSGFSNTKKKCDFRTKGLSKDDKVSKTVMDILDDRMQISCAISGKHHCKWECEEETDLSDPRGNAEKPKRRRSLSRAKLNDCVDGNNGEALDFDKGIYGKIKEVNAWDQELRSQAQENQIMETNELEKKSVVTNFPSCSQNLLESPSLSCNTNVSATNNTAADCFNSPNIQCLPLVVQEENEKNFETEGMESSRKDEVKTSSNSGQMLRESLESFRRGCAIGNNVASGCPSDSDDDISINLSNPFWAAILRTKRSKNNKIRIEKEGLEKHVKESDSRDIRENPFKNFLNSKEVKKTEWKAEKVEKKAKFRSPEKRLLLCSATGTCKSAAVKGPKDLCLEDELDETSNGHKVENDEENGNGASDDSSNVKTIPVPSAHDKLRFRRSLDTAAQLVFHRCSGLPLTSSPAPVRRNNNSFAFDSSLNSVSAIKSALFEPANSLSSEDENESEGSLKSPASPGAWSLVSKRINYHTLSPLPLLGSFEESVLNGRLEPVSTVQGFTAELGASGSFCPRHLYLPVTVFFYTLGDNDKVSAPYLGHINLGKKGYNVPRSGTIQVTLFNPLRTVVKMFVVVYDLTDMPANSHTFLRQRTLYVPASQKESVHTDQNRAPFDQEDYHKHLRYLIHLRFVSGKTGRIYLHTDIRMVIFRKADEDTATALGKQIDGETYELRSHTNGPANPKFSPRK